MSVFSTNQARQFYVLKGTLQTSSAPDATNTVQVVTTNPNAPYIVCNGAAGNTRSDLLTNIESVKHTDAAALATPLKTAVVTVTATGSADTKGKDCVLKITVRQFAGISDEETYTIYGSARISSATETAAQIAADIKANLEKTLNKGLNKDLFEVSITGAAITIKEKEQDWTLGIKPQVPVYFDVTLVSIDEDVTPTVSGATTTYDWGTVTTGTDGTIGNGKKIADMEYFYMGERGDIYRNINWPNSIPTKYLVDSTATYDVLDIHYSYVGSGEGVQKSEKDVTIVTPHANATQLAALAKAIAAVAGFSNYKHVKSDGSVEDIATSAGE